MQAILSTVRRAVEDFNMIEDGDRIAVGLSGGKDSIAVLLALKNLSIFYPKKFEILAITIDMGMEGNDFSSLKQLCEENNIEYVIEKTDIYEIVFNERKETNPCSLCAKMRRGALNTMAQKYNCNKIALGHHKDDVMETFLMSLLFEGRIHTFAPVTYLSRSDVHVIRPLVYTEECEIKRLMRKRNISIMKNKCPADGNTIRQDMKELICDLAKINKRVRECIFGAITRSNIKGWQINGENE